MKIVRKITTSERRRMGSRAEVMRKVIRH